MSIDASLPRLACRERLVNDTLSAAAVVPGTDALLSDRTRVVAIEFVNKKLIRIGG